MKLNKIVFVLGLLALILSSISALAQGEERRSPRERWELASIQARVEAIDFESREVLLRGPAGELVTVTADETVKRFKEIEVGDYVAAEFWTYILAEFRDPTPEERNEPLVILVEAGKAPEGMPPGAAIGAIVKAVITIEIINRPDMLVTVKGPMGNFVSVQVLDPSLITQLNIGEVGILTYAESLALTLKKVPAGN